MLFQPSNIAPSTLSGIGIGTVDVTQGIDVSWQVNGDSPMTDYQITIYQNDSGSTQMYTTGQITLLTPFQTHDAQGNPQFFSTSISAATLSTAGIVNGYANGYKLIIKQWWGVNDYVEQTSAAVFITRTTPTVSINAIPNPVTTSSATITATYAQAQGDPISTVEWIFALAGLEDTPIKQTGAINTQVLSFEADGLITGNTYSIMCNVVTSNGVEVSTGFVQFSVSYASSTITTDYQVAQLRNSSAVYLSWDGFSNNILAYPYANSTKTTNGITFTVNGEGDMTANGTASANAYFTLAQGTLSQIGLTAGQKVLITSGYHSAIISVVEKNGSNVTVSTVTGGDPLQYVVPETSNTLSISFGILKGTSLTTEPIRPMIYVEDDITVASGISAYIEPAQNLGGYSKPWAAGAGINKAYWPALTNASSNGIDYTISDDGNVLHIEGTATATSSAWASSQSTSYSNMPLGPFPAGTYTINALGFVGQAALDRIVFSARYIDNTVVSGANSIRITSPSGVIPDGSGRTYTFTASSDFKIGFYQSIESGTSVNCDVKIQLEAASELGQWTPYSNECPITGITGVSVRRTGKNLFRVARGWSSHNGVVYTENADGTVHCKGTATAESFSAGNAPSVDADNRCLYPVPAGTYTVSNIAGVRLWLNFRNAENTGDVRSGANVAVGSSKTFTFTEPTIIYVRSDIATGTVVDADMQVMVTEGSTAATVYEPWQMQTVAVDWTSTAGTVYDGTVDLATGVLTSTMANIASYNGETIGEPWLSSLDEYVSGATPTTGAQVVYTLATPVEYQLTPQEMALVVGDGLDATNNIWSSAGNVEITYTNRYGDQETVSGEIVTINDSDAKYIQPPQYRPTLSSVSIYRYIQGDPILRRVYDYTDNSTTLLDYFVPSQTTVSYLIAGHGASADVFAQTNMFSPVFWFCSILLCSQDSNGYYHVRSEYVFKYGIETGAVSNNNTPSIQTNFTRYPTRQPISSLYKTGSLKGYIGTVSDQKLYSDSVSLQNAIYDISTSRLTKFLKTRKGETIMVECSAPIQMQTGDNMVQQPLVATIDWVEVGDSSEESIVSIPSDSFWPM